MSTQVRHDPAQSRFIVEEDGQLAGFAEYVEQDGFRDFNHTVVFEEFQGRGLSKPLIKTALDQTLEEGLTIQPTCPAVVGFIQKNPEYAEKI